MLKLLDDCPQTSAKEQEKEAARRLLDQCIEQLASASIGDAEWLEAWSDQGPVEFPVWPWPGMTSEEILADFDRRRGWSVVCR